MDEITILSSKRSVSVLRAQKKLKARPLRCWANLLMSKNIPQSPSVFVSFC